MRSRLFVPALFAAGGALCVVAHTARAQSFQSANCGALLLSPEVETLGPAGGIKFYSPVDVEGDSVPDDIQGDDASVVVKYRGGAAKPNQILGGPGELATRVLLARDLDRVAGAELVVARASSVDVLHADASGALSVLASVPYPAASTRSSLLAWAGSFRSRYEVDLLFGDTNTGALSLYAFDGAKLAPVPGLTELVSGTGAPMAFTTAIGDMDGDGLDDVVFAVDGGVKLARLGMGTVWDVFQTLTLPNPGSQCAAVAAGDFDGDGRKDIAVEPASLGTTATLDSWLQTTAGVFTPLPEATASAWAAGGRLFVGDLDSDEHDDLVTRAVTAHLVGETWQHSSPLAFDEALDLSDVNFDGAPELTATDAGGDLVRASYANADISFTWDPANSTNDSSGPTLTELTITNDGPTATRGIAFTTDLDGATLNVSECADAANGCPDLVIPANSVLFAQLKQDPSRKRSAFDLTLCSGAPDPVPSNASLHVPLTTNTLADLGVSMSAAFSLTGEFGATAYVQNGGPAFANDLTVSITVDPPQPIGGVETDPSTANCTSNATGVTCTLDLLAPGELWSVGVDLVYYGDPMQITTTAASANPDSGPNRNSYVYTIPGGLKPAAPRPGSPASSTGGATNASAGCACGVERQGGSVQSLLGIVAGLWLLLRRRIRYFARHATSVSGPGAAA